MTKTYGPYSPIRKVGNLYFVSGQIGLDFTSGKCANNISQQTRQAIHNLKEILKTQALDLNDIVKTTIFMTDIGNFTKVNEIYAEIFGSSKPARSAVGVTELPRLAGETKVLIEIEAIAAKKDHD